MAMMKKTYRRDDAGVLFYREAWKDRGLFFLHEGKVGTKGKRNHSSTRSRTWPDKPTATEYMREFAAQAEADGFVEIPAEEQGWVVLQLWTNTPDLQDPSDAWILDEGQDALDDHLGWLGVGHCDGNDVGGTPPAEHTLEGTVVNLFCRVVDIQLGVKAVRSFVRKFDLAPNFVIGSREPGETTEYVLAWSPRKRDKTFTL